MVLLIVCTLWLICLHDSRSYGENFSVIGRRGKGFAVGAVGDNELAAAGFGVDFIASSLASMSPP
jgi:hypothetical protein